MWGWEAQDDMEAADGEGLQSHDRHTWRPGARSALCAASQLSGREPTNVDVAAVPAR